ncbi:Wadjet anti-phage system protein JetA family protein [Candidatus Ferrigenium straubiae]|uniref:Wadjet anti-phage system protein JetA family protein n=1 Tax=Candidatus Ferrigenium straubiae TaxID=2919506 RepID=UPI003F4ACA82
MNLFDRIPIGLFSALTGKNNRRAWNLIVRLYDQYFGPDAVPDYAEGYLHEKVIKEIERFLLDAGWENESEEASPLATPLVIQANQLLNRLVETGWLIEESVGLKNFVSMRPSVAHLFDLLRQFTNEGPQLLGGNILLIYNQLKGAIQDPKAQASGFASAAHLSAQLINSLSATTLRARDLMKELIQEDTTPNFVRRFFSEHIGELYVRDFKQLRTENHPLRLRYEIIEMVSELTTNEGSRMALLSGYAELPGAISGEEEESLERDVRRFRKLLDVEKFLERMDQVVDSATQRAIAYMGYRLKASERIEEVIADTINAVIKAEEREIPLHGKLLSPDPLFSEERLRMPASPPPKPVRTALKKREMTVHEKAKRLLRKAMLQHRQTSPAAMKRYIETHIKPGETITAENLPIKTVEDAVAYLVLLRFASAITKRPSSVSKNPLMHNLGFDAELTNEPRVDGVYFNTPHFKITRRIKDAK